MIKKTRVESTSRQGDPNLESLEMAKEELNEYYPPEKKMIEIEVDIVEKLKV